MISADKGRNLLQINYSKNKKNIMVNNSLNAAFTKDIVKYFMSIRNDILNIL